MLKINDNLINLVNDKEKELASVFKEIDDNALYFSKKVLDAFHNNNLNTSDLIGTNGYGYDDFGRDKIERIYSDIFESEDALVRREFISGSHAISTSLFGILRPGDTFLSISGTPYDTMHEVIGIKRNNSSLMSFGINYKEIDLIDNSFNYDLIKNSLDNIKMVYIQRSIGYSTRKSIGINELEKVIKFIKNINKDIIIFVDNCYCEFVERKNPISVGADICIGSLIKNLGSGICTHGAYVVGRKDLIHLISERLTLPGEGKEAGPSIDANKMFLMGLYYAPSVISSSLKINYLFSKVMESLGYVTSPSSSEKRYDIVLSIYMNNKDNLIKFTQLLQASGAVNSNVLPIPSDMPGYKDKIIMASPSFTQGSSIELSCDAPLREPYVLYIQGGISYEYGKLALLNIISNLDK